MTFYTKQSSTGKIKTYLGKAQNGVLILSLSVSLLFTSSHFAFSACTDPDTSAETEDERSLVNPPSFYDEGGIFITTYLQDWWTNDFLPDLKDMVAELNTAVVDETRNIGSLIDAQTQEKTQRIILKHEFDQKVDELSPNEQTCQIGSQSAALMKAEYIGTAIRVAMEEDEVGRELNVNNDPGVTTPIKTSITRRGSSEDTYDRWETYVSVFCDMTQNNEQTSCAADGTLPNADINIEQFLLQDTIDMSDPDQRDGVYAMQRNLISPRITRPLEKEILETSDGKDTYLERRRSTALRQVAHSVLAGIISRRAPVPDTTTGPMVAEIRTRAGIPVADQNVNAPSYNEMMLALTKERFFNPEYYINASQSKGAVQQEQTALDVMITTQLQDIYDLQEQINALAATKASIKFNDQSTRTSTQSSAPK